MTNDDHHKTSSDSFTIRPLATIDEFRQAEDVQRLAWNWSTERSIVPLNMMVALQHHGGLTAGAFNAEGKLIGFVLSFLGRTGRGKLKHCSHMLGVIPEARQQEIGFRLKVFQRQYILQHLDLDLITWTFDPLEAVNAHLNINKLGCVTRKYIYNIYGEWNEGINQGLPTDRFEVEWWLDSPRVRERMQGTPPDPAPAAVTVLQAEPSADGLARPGSFVHDADAPVLRVEIPFNFQAIKSASMELAMEWRHATASIFETYFARGYCVVSFSRGARGGRNTYLLTETPPDLPDPDAE